MDKLFILTEIIRYLPFELSVRLRLIYSLIFEGFSKLCLFRNSLEFQGDEAENTSSAQVVDDLLIEIIQRLPLKQTVQLRLVSKYWNSLILDPKLRLLRNRPAVSLIFEVFEYRHLPTWYSTFVYSYIISLDKSIGPPIRKMTPTKDTWYQRSRIIHSCNGLLLCVGYGAHVIRKYYICNPTTRKYIVLPFPEVVLDRSMMICEMYLAFDPSKSPYYKVVCVLRPYGEGLYLFEVYSSETGSWRKCGNNKLFEHNVDFDFDDGVYWNGAIVWVNIFTKSRESVYFSLDCDQTLKVFPNPPLQDKRYGGRNGYYFGESLDHLHFVDAYRELDAFIVYEMKKDYSEWFLKYKVNISEIRRDYFEWFVKHKVNVPDYDESSLKNEVNFQIYTVVRGKNDDDSCLVIATGRRIARYNFEQKNCETLCELDSTVTNYSLFWGPKCVFQYTESICSV